MSPQEVPKSSAPPSSRRSSATFVREDDIPTSSSRFTESFPPPPILLKPKPGPASIPVPQPYRVVVACDLTEFSEGVLREGIAFAHGHMPAELHLVTVVEQVRDHYILHHDEKRRHISREVLESLMNDVIWRVNVQKGSPFEEVMSRVALHVCIGDPATELLRLSREVMADLIVVGSRQHQGLHRRVWGSVSKTVMAHADCSVVLSRPIDFVHGRRTPSIEAPRMFESERHHLEPHHYRI